MRRLVVLAVTAASLCAVAACGVKPQPSAPPASSADPAAFTGTVAETANASGYTYARLQAEGRDDVWIAAPAFVTQKGESLTATLEMPMPNFESKTLGRTFPLVYFVTTVSRDGQIVAGSPDSAMPGPMTSRDSAPRAVTVAANPPPSGGLSIADVWAQRKALAGKEVTVRGTVVKVNNGILGKNWIHLQDGSGSATDGTNDLTLTTDAEVNAGDVVTVTGVLATNKDIGSGYKYDAIIEDARLVK
ncbi:MAG: hypothetical protein WD227_10185 [Vicinamibacterales bacterium]